MLFPTYWIRVFLLTVLLLSDHLKIRSNEPSCCLVPIFWGELLAKKGLKTCIRPCCTLSGALPTLAPALPPGPHNPSVSLPLFTNRVKGRWRGINPPSCIFRTSWGTRSKKEDALIIGASTNHLGNSASSWGITGLEDSSSKLGRTRPCRLVTNRCWLRSKISSIELASCEPGNSETDQI